MKIRINLSALTREEYSKEVEVPDDTSDADLDRIVTLAYEVCDGSEFTEDNEYWEKGNCWWEKIR